MASFFVMGGAPKSPQGQVEMRRKIVRQTGKDHPQVLYIPPDGGAAEGHWPLFRKRMTRIGCTVQPLFLLRQRPNEEVLRRYVEAADIVFVGGGNTLRMMRMWRRFGVDKLLVDAARSEKVFAGVSAGAICWFDYGHSDSRDFSGKPDWKYVRVRGLGLVPGTLCPHVVAEGRIDNFKAMMEKFGGVGYGVDDGSALLVRDGIAEIVGNPQGVFLVTRSGIQPMRSSFVLTQRARL